MNRSWVPHLEQRARRFTLSNGPPDAGWLYSYKGKGAYQVLYLAQCARYRSASSAAAQPWPAAVMAWR